MAHAFLPPHWTAASLCLPALEAPRGFLTLLDGDLAGCQGSLPVGHLVLHLSQPHLVPEARSPISKKPCSHCTRSRCVPSSSDPQPCIMLANFTRSSPISDHGQRLSLSLCLFFSFFFSVLLLMPSQWRDHTLRQKWSNKGQGSFAL